MNEYTFKINTKIKSCYSDAYSMNGYCPFHFYDLRSGNHCSLSDDVKCLKTKRPENCPLKEVSPHGDLKDYDALGNKMSNLYIKNKENWSPDYIEGFIRALKMLDKAPTVLEAR